MKSENPRIESILAAITKIAAGNLDTRIEISDALDEFDGVATGINMLAEEVNSRIAQHEDENKQLNETIAQLKKVKAQLSDSEHIFSQVFQTSPDSISISRLDSGEFVEVNRNLSTKMKIPLIDQYEYFSPFYKNDPENYTKIMLDGLHVNPIGNAIMGIIATRLFSLPDPYFLDKSFWENVKKFLLLMSKLPSKIPYPEKNEE